MKVYEGVDDFVPVKNPVVTIGTFDGVHLGHQKILSRIRGIADEINGETVLITFWPHPRLVLYPKEHNIRLLTSFEEKCELLEQFGIDHLVSIPFTHEFSEMRSQDFIHKILIKKINTRKLVIGYDHRFGRGREGGFEHLKANQSRYGFDLEEISRQDIHDVGISSTKIRKALETGDIKTANSFLGREFALDGIVIKGQQIGRSMGFPTANISIPNEYKLVPMDGAYIVNVALEKKILKGMLNIGNRPTVNGEVKTVEVHLFDFNENLYGKHLKVYFKEFLRPEKKFGNLEELKAQLEKDREASKRFLENL
jgi:riboflavin kinase / FMN adenylyltransferase